MLSRLVQLWFRPAEGKASVQLLSSVQAAASQFTTNGLVQPASFCPEQQHTHYSSRSSPVQAKQQPKSKALAQKLRAQPGSDVLERVKTADPTEPQLQLLKVVLESDKPLNSHELYAQAQQQFGSMFGSRSQFKKHLKCIMRRKWVTAKPPTKHSGKESKAISHYVYSGTPVGYKLDLNSPGMGLHALARAQADEWTKNNLPSYADHLRQGRVPATGQNLGVLQPHERPQVFRRQLFGAKSAAAGPQSVEGGQSRSSRQLEE